MKRWHKWWWVALLVVVALARLVTLQGVWRPVRIVGGSMAPVLHGQAYRLRCADCGTSFWCGAEYIELNDLATCPNCGFANNHTELHQLTAGQRVLIDRARYWWKAPQRLELAAFHSADQLAVKRIIGMPGETLAINHGDILINDRRLQKSLRQFRQMAIPVYDSAHPPAANRHLRWQLLDTAGNWSRRRTGWVADQPQVEQLLTYHQRPCFPDPAPPLPPGASTDVWDTYGYNQHLSRGPLVAVTDLLLDIRFRAEDLQQLQIRQRCGQHELAAIISVSESQVQVLVDGEQQATFSVLWPTERDQELCWAFCDQRLMLEANGQRIVEWSPSRPLFGSHEQPLALSWSAAQLQIQRLKLLRDVQYLGPDPTAASWAMPEPLQGYFVLGDNVPVSIDSRLWGRGVVESDLLGPVWFRRQAE